MKHVIFMFFLNGVSLQGALAAGADAWTHPSVCSASDSRVLSQVMGVGRVLSASNDDAEVCSGALISKTCMVSAGHCIVKLVEFNVPLSNPQGKLSHSEPIDQYQLDRIVGKKPGVDAQGPDGQDWLVFRLKPNRITGKKPGEVQGSYRVNRQYHPLPSDIAEIIGYGTSFRPEHNFSQQIARGSIEQTSLLPILQYTIDTDGGNSGSPIILEASQEIIGIHTDGFCTPSGGFNEGTALLGNTDLNRAIDECLSSEE